MTTRIWWRSSTLGAPPVNDKKTVEVGEMIWLVALAIKKRFVKVKKYVLVIKNSPLL